MKKYKARIEGVYLKTNWSELIVCEIELFLAYYGAYIILKNMKEKYYAVFLIIPLIIFIIPVVRLFKHKHLQEFRKSGVNEFSYDEGKGLLTIDDKNVEFILESPNSVVLVDDAEEQNKYLVGIYCPIYYRIARTGNYEARVFEKKGFFQYRMSEEQMMSFFGLFDEENDDENDLQEEGDTNGQ